MTQTLIVISLLFASINILALQFRIRDLEKKVKALEESKTT
jgi:hypothetical protein